MDCTQLNHRLDDLVQFEKGPWKPGYRRPLIYGYSKGDLRTGNWEDFAGSHKIMATHDKPSQFPVGSPLRKSGMITYPNVGASAEYLKHHPHLQKTYGTPENMSRALLRHELAHSLLEPENITRGNIRIKDPSKLHKLPIEARALGSELFSSVKSEILNKPKRRLNTPLIHRIGSFIGGLRSLSSELNDLIEFKTLYQPKGADEPPETLPELQGLVDYTVQRHAARRAGLHRDIRIGTKRHGLLSWATRKDLPREGGKIAIHPQSVHPHSYLGWQGNIPEGYGAGDVSTEHLGKALVTASSPTEVHATLADQKEHHRLAFVKTPKGWLLARGKQPEPPAEAVKPTYKSIGPDKAKEALGSLPEGSIVQPKVDGALVYVTTKGNRPEVFSHRKSKVSNKNIIHTERFFHGRPTTNIPKEHQRTLLGELYGTRRGKAIEPQELGGILNSHLNESISKQKARGVKLRIMPFDYADGKGETYPERLEKVKQTVQHLPKDKFHTPEEARTPGASRALFEKIRSGRHPLTREGVVVHTPHGRMTKIKNVEESNVRISGTFPGTGKFEGSHGGFTYEGGQVGTGFSDETRRKLHEYVGLTARIRHQGQYKSGAYRAPSFIAVND